MWLTDEELVELTGYRRHADQRRWLNSHGWTHVVSGSGRPIVARSYADSMLGSIETQERHWMPNLAAIR